MESYLSLLEKGKAPSIEELILSQTYTHDHILKNPNDIRKFFQTNILDNSRTRKIVTPNQLCDDTDGCVEELDIQKSRTLYSILTKDGSVCMMLYDITPIPSGSKSPCCTKHINRYIGLDIGNSTIQIRCMQILVNKCSDYGGGIRFGNPEPCVIPEINLKTILILNPALVMDLNLEENLETVLKMLKD